jgi:hypothetical protein
MTACEIAWLAPWVIGQRTGRMMATGGRPDARDRRECQRMGQEKVDAFSEAMMAAATAWPMMGAAALQASLAPFHRRVRANHRRLARW